jgi:hypothetical protein
LCENSARWSINLHLHAHKTRARRPSSVLAFLILNEARRSARSVSSLCVISSITRICVPVGGIETRIENPPTTFQIGAQGGDLVDSGSRRLGSALGQANGTNSGRKRLLIGRSITHPPYPLRGNASSQNGVATAFPSDALTRVDITPPSSTTPPLHYTLLSWAPSPVHRARSNARLSNWLHTTPSTPTTPQHSALPLGTTRPAPIVSTLHGRCHTSFSTVMPSGRREASSSTPSIITLPTTFFPPKTAVVASSNSFTQPKPYSAPCPHAPLTRLGPEPGRFVPRRPLLLSSSIRLTYLGFSEETGCRVTEAYAPLSQHYPTPPYPPPPCATTFIFLRIVT